jgi:23S rRNA (guanosine2251-2'-O)-methyltransferase
MQRETILIFGRHPVLTALKESPQLVVRVWAKKGALADVQALYPKVLSFETASEALLSILEEVHQGYAAEITLSRLVQPYRTFIQEIEVTSETMLVILDEIQDPHNVGAVIRSAAAFGAQGVLFPEHNQAPVSGAVIKASAGEAFHVPLVSIGNVNQVIRDLKQRGFWIYGLSGEGNQRVEKEQFTKPTAFILGSESDGIRQKTKDLCDILLSIAIHPRTESLNVSTASAIALYKWASQHEAALSSDQ